ncbi:MAG: MFS transporter [Dehalogenimonas sp.]|uniref:MFS transporter n=1 Tax=Candidatus Dehalogenimonas loeffleri TaxID=3127115 RepID=A0ABZ2J8G7_9CHLR|nr:MFS transporter [Dehalogenimonas sp.]
MSEPEQIPNSPGGIFPRFFRHFPANLRPVFILSVLNSAGFSFSLPFLSLYLHQQRDVSMAMVGIFILASGLIAAAVQMYAGMLCDRYGRRPLIIWSQLTNAVFYLVMAVLVYVVAPVWTIIITYILVRASLMASRPATSALVVDLMPTGRLVEGYGILRLGQNLGFGLGPVIGGYFWLTTSYAWLFVAAAFIGVAALVVSYLQLKESVTSLNMEKITLRAMLLTTQDKTFLGFTLISIIAFMGLGQFISTLSVYTVDRIGLTTVQYGSLLMVNAGLVVTLQYPLSRLINRMKRASALLLGMVVYAAGYVMIGLAGVYGLFILAMGIITIGEVIFSPVSMTVVGELSPVSLRGRYQGFYGLAETLGISLGPTLGGALLDTTAPDGRIAVWGPIAGLILISGFAFYIWGKRQYPETIRETST